MSKSLEELILGAENQAAASAAIRRAAERANILELRRAARQEKKQQDEEHRERHRQILKLMDGPQAEWIRQKAHEQIDKWERNKLCIPRYWVMWREWLAMPAPYLEAAVLREDDLGVSMRQNSPFDHSFHLVKPDLRRPEARKVKSTEELMFGAENQAAVSAAVWRAVARAEALGLPRAYKPLPPELQEREERERQLNQAGQDRA